MKALDRLANFFGYEVLIRSRQVQIHGGLQLYQYQRSDGSFDYDRYRRVQIVGNRRKLDHMWVREENIAMLSYYIRKNIPDPRFGICHGTRRGKEQEWFSKYLHCDVLGTDISDTANEFPNTIQWDFHDVKKEWLDNVDFIYSNSFDHTYDPQKCLNAWMSCMNANGLCIIEHSSGHERATELDPFGAPVAEMPYFVLKWASGRFCVTEVLSAVSEPPRPKYVEYLIIRRLDTLTKGSTR